MKSKDQVLEESRITLEKRFNDLGIVHQIENRGGTSIVKDDVLYICGGEHMELWKIKITSHQMTFRPGFDLHEDLIAIANNIRKDYFNVI